MSRDFRCTTIALPGDRSPPARRRTCSTSSPADIVCDLGIQLQSSATDPAGRPSAARQLMVLAPQAIMPLRDDPVTPKPAQVPVRIGLLWIDGKDGSSDCHPS